MGVGGCETKTIGYTCRSVALKVFGPGFNSRRLHQSSPLGYLTEGAHVFGREFPGNPGHPRRSAGALGHLYGCLELSCCGRGSTGNLYEWVEDSYDDVFYTMNPAVNPRDPLEGTTRCSGSCSNTPYRLRSSFRTKSDPAVHEPNGGFRCAQDAPPLP